MVWINGGAAVVDKNYFVADLADIWGSALQLKSEPTGLLSYAQRRTKQLEQVNTVLENFTDPYQLQQGYGTS